MDICFSQRPSVHRPENVPAGEHNMGRLIAPDPRDAAFLLGAVRRQIGTVVKALRRKRWGIDLKRLPVDQGPTPRCTGFASASAAIVGPNTQRKTLPTTDDAESLANELYIRALDLDEWEGNDRDSGTSVRAIGKAGVERGLWGGFAWAETPADVRAFVLNFGPALAGTIWPDCLMETDANGFLLLTPGATMDGRHAQGHCYCLAQIDLDMVCPDGSRGGFVGPQTWGKGWGWKGRGEFKMPFTTFDPLFQAQGEAMLPTEKTLKPSPALAAILDGDKN